MTGRTVVVGFDGSAAAVRAAGWAVRRCTSEDRVVIVSVARDGERPDGLHASPAAAHRARQRLDTLMTGLAGREDGPVVDGVIAEGRVADVVLQTADALEADEIVLGAHLGAPFRPNVVDGVLRNAHRPVVVVPA